MVPAAAAEGGNVTYPGHHNALGWAQLALLQPPGELASQSMKSATAIANCLRRGLLVERHEAHDPIHLRAVLPVELCPTMNELLRLHFGAKSSIQKKTLNAIWTQNHCKLWATPLKGRPLVRCIRFTPRATDEDASFTKVPLDVLTTGVRGGGPHHLGVVEDDNREAIETRTWWEPSPTNMQFVYLDVSGGTT